MPLIPKETMKRTSMWTWSPKPKELIVYTKLTLPKHTAFTLATLFSSAEIIYKHCEDSWLSENTDPRWKMLYQYKPSLLLTVNNIISRKRRNKI